MRLNNNNLLGVRQVEEKDVGKSHWKRRRITQGRENKKKECGKAVVERRSVFRRVIFIKGVNLEKASSVEKKCTKKSIGRPGSSWEG